MMSLDSTPQLGWRTGIGRFFHTEEIPYGLALVRIALPWALMCAMLPRWQHARELFSSDGAPTPLWFSYGYPDLLPEFPGAVVVGLHSALLLLFVAMSLGWCTRISVVASFVIYTYLNLADAISTMTKYSVIASHVLLLLSVSHCGAVWSIDAWLKRRRNAQRCVLPQSPPRFAVWPRRLIQILIGTVYFGAALTKLHTPEFFSGDQLQSWMVTNVNWGHSLGEYLTLYPPLLVIFAYITIVFEITFLFLAWSGWKRVIMLILGATFHVMTTLTLGLYIFPMVCLSAYAAFLGEDDVHRFAAQLVRIQKWCTRRIAKPIACAVAAATRPLPNALRLPSPALFSLAILLTVVGGIEAEYWMDPYGERRLEGRYTLKELDRELVETTFLAPTRRVRQTDKFVALDVGSVLVGGLLADRRERFKQGETVTVQCSLNTPHEDMWVECNLHDASNRLITRSGQVVPREVMRSNYYYDLDETLEPGTYFFVVESSGKEVMRKQVTIRPGRVASVDAPVAN